MSQASIIDPFADDELDAPPAEPPAHYLDGVFGATGVLAQRFAGYQPRTGQIALAHAVDHAIAGTRHLMAEGPTGTGKSLAYAVPAAYHAARHGRRVVIVTANIALTEQLAQKDLPLLQEILPWEFTFALLKGRSNYLCVDRLLDMEAERARGRQRGFGFGSSDEMPAPGSMDAEVIETIKAWANLTETGDVSELPFVPDPQVWRRFSRGSDECKGNKCKSFHGCHAYNAKRKSRAAHIIVTNYHLLFASMIVRRLTNKNVILPGYDVAILDEGHKAAEIAREFFGFQISAGRITRLGRQLLKLKDDARVTELEKKLRGATHGFFDQLGEYKRRGGYKVRLKEALAGDSVIAPYYKQLDDALDQTAYMLRQIAGAQGSTDEKADWQKAALRAAEIRCCIESAMTLEDPEDMVYYLLEERAGDGGARITLGSKPIRVDGKIRDELFNARPAGEVRPKSTFRTTDIFDDEDDEPSADERRERGLRDKRTVIVTSATLSVNGGFGYIASELGAPEGEYDGLIAESPFDWERQALLIVPEGLPDPSSEREKHGKAVPDVVVEVVKLAHGRTLGLFTSYAALDKSYAALKKAGCPYRVLKQGDMPRMKLVDEFRRDVPSVLLGTESLWAGVDVSGESLSVVVIDKMPFPTPDDPVLDAIASKDPKGWFFKHAIPRAVIQFKQGFGRLIRSVTDIGVVVFCDPRIISKGYGKAFLASLPEVQRSRKLEHLTEFLPPPSAAPVNEAAPAATVEVADDGYGDDIPF